MRRQVARTKYVTEEEALRRVETLKASGIWPGVIRCSDGTFTLTYDPEVLRWPAG
jgi:hypothetical protein